MKRPLLHRLFGYWLVLLVLTASVGLTVQQHTCRQSGKHTAAIVFGPVRHSCPPSQPNQAARHGAHQTGKARLTQACCEFGAHFHKLDAPSAKLAWVKAPVPELATVAAEVHWPARVASQVCVTTIGWHGTDASPPPRAGRVLLAFVGVLIV